MNDTSSGRLRGLTAVVTGAGRGIGRSIVHRFAAEGANVVAAARSEDQIGEVVAEVEAAGGAAVAIATDVTDDEQVARLAAGAVEAFGAVDILVNNAGIHVAGRFEELDMDAWYRASEVNVHGTVRVTRAFLGQMLERRSGPSTSPPPPGSTARCSRVPTTPASTPWWA
jgi:NADP-dependent 3-hydroxy acid dehydrogenase YdfG